jgi:hypothetical protein
MFKKKAVQVTFVDQPRKAESSTPEKTTSISPETVTLITERAKEVAKFVGLVVIGTYAAIVAIDTVSQIAIKKTKSADNE